MIQPMNKVTTARNVLGVLLLLVLAPIACLAYAFIALFLF
jgi:hypothetical protein